MEGGGGGGKGECMCDGVLASIDTESLLRIHVGLILGHALSHCLGHACWNNRVGN